MNQMYDVCEMYKDLISKKVTWKSTPFTNLPYALAKFKKRVLEIDKKYPKGTFFIIIKNGNNPLKKFRVVTVDYGKIGSGPQNNL